MNGAEYEEKVSEFLRHHPDHPVIHRLRTDQSLTAIDLKVLEKTP